MTRPVHAFGLLPALALLVLGSLCVPPATAATPAPERPPFVLIEVHPTSGPWQLLVKAKDGHYEKLDASGATALTDEPLPHQLDAHAPGSAGILSVSLADALTWDKDSLFQQRLLPALARYLGIPGDDLRIRTPPLTPSPIGEDLLNDDRYVSDQQMFLPFITTFDGLRLQLQSQDAQSRSLALNALRIIPGTRANRLLVAALTNSDADIRAGAERQLISRGVKAREVLQAAVRADASPDNRALPVLHRVEYDSTMRAPTPANFTAFLARYPRSRFADEIRYRLLTANGDSDGLKKLVDSFPNQGRGDIRDLLDAGALEIVAKSNTREQFFPGQMLNLGRNLRYAPEMTLELKRTVPYPLKVRIPVGTWFANPKATQDTVATGGTIAELIGEQSSITVPAVYINRFELNGFESGLKFTVERMP